MTSPARQRVSLRWRRDDCVALVVLVGAWGAYLVWAGAAGGGLLGGAVATDPHKIDLVRERIDPNTATAASLRRLSMIGPEKAKAIVDYRRAKARAGGRAFHFVEDLQDVPGIGPGIVARVRDFVTLPRLDPAALPAGGRPAGTGR